MSSVIESSDQREDAPSSRPQMPIDDTGKVSDNVIYQHGASAEAVYQNEPYRRTQERQYVEAGDPPLTDRNMHKGATASEYTELETHFQNDFDKNLESDQTSKSKQVLSHSHPGRSNQAQNKNLYNRSKSLQEQDQVYTCRLEEAESAQNLTDAGDFGCSVNRFPGTAVRVNDYTDESKTNIRYIGSDQGGSFEDRQKSYMHKEHGRHLKGNDKYFNNDSERSHHRGGHQGHHKPNQRHYDGPHQGEGNSNKSYHVKNKNKNYSGRSKAESGSDLYEGGFDGHQRKYGQSEKEQHNMHGKDDRHGFQDHGRHKGKYKESKIDHEAKMTAGASESKEKGDRKREALKKTRKWKTHDCEVENSKMQEALQKYTYFWRDHDVYSQWHKSTFVVDGKVFEYAEQFMMYKKAELFEDRYIAKKILKADHPREMKALGRKVKNFSEEIWAHNCLHIVKEANVAKFSQNEHMKEKLLNTFPKVLVEASPYDTLWGIGLAWDWEAAWDILTWNGKNLLGYILTEVRDDFLFENGTINQEERKTYLEDLKKVLIEERVKNNHGQGRKMTTEQESAAGHPNSSDREVRKEGKRSGRKFDDDPECSEPNSVCSEGAKGDEVGKEYEDRHGRFETGNGAEIVGQNIGGKASVQLGNQNLDAITDSNVDTLEQSKAAATPDLVQEEESTATVPSSSVDRNPFQDDQSINCERSVKEEEAKSFDGNVSISCINVDIKDFEDDLASGLDIGSLKHV